MHPQNTILKMPISEEELFFDWALLGYTSRRPGWNNSLIEEWGGVTNINFYGIICRRVVLIMIYYVEGGLDYMWDLEGKESE